MPLGLPMNASKFFKRWSRRHRQFLDEALAQLGLAREHGEAEDIHRLRVALRRLRLLAWLGAPIHRRRVLHEFRSWSAQICYGAGRVRDLDISLEQFPPNAAFSSPARRVRENRRQLWLALRPQLQAPAPRMIRQMSRFKAGALERRLLWARYEGEVKDLRRQLAEAAPRFFALELPEQHAFRRSLRRLRYLREIELSKKAQAADPQLRQWIALQEALGEYQNLVTALEVLGPAGRSARAGQLRAQMTARQDRWLQEIRRRIRSFIRRPPASRSSSSTAGSRPVGEQSHGRTHSG